MRLVLALCCAAHAFVGPQRSAPPRLQATAQEISAKTEGTETIFSLEEVQKILPHRYPFALVDKVIEYEAGKSAVGVKCVTFNEPQFTGHFPDRPIMPGVMQIEALAQLAGVVCLQMEGAEPGAGFFFAGVFFGLAIVWLLRVGPPRVACRVARCIRRFPPQKSAC